METHSNSNSSPSSISQSNELKIVMSRIELKYDKKKKTYYLEGPFRDKLKLPEEDDSEHISHLEDGWLIPEVSYVFRSWLDNNERDFIREMEDPQIKMSLKDTH